MKGDVPAYVYAIKVGDFVKIGVTLDLQRRLQQISKRDGHTLYPAELPKEPAQIVGWLEGDMRVEKALHERFKPYYVGVGEWFHWNDHLAAWWSEQGQGSPDPKPSGMTARDLSLAIRFTPDEMRHIGQLAEVEDRTKGGMVRRLVGEAITAREQKETK